MRQFLTDGFDDLDLSPGALNYIGKPVQKDEPKLTWRDWLYEAVWRVRAAVDVLRYGDDRLD